MSILALLVEQAFASGEAWMPGPILVSNLKAHLPQEPSFAGPLMGGGSTKELNKWIDERVAIQSPHDASRLLLGVLKVACQHYGKLRSSSANSGNSAMVGFGATSCSSLQFDFTLIHSEASANVGVISVLWGVPVAFGMSAIGCCCGLQQQFFALQSIAGMAAVGCSCLGSSLDPGKEERAAFTDVYKGMRQRGHGG